MPESFSPEQEVDLFKQLIRFPTVSAHGPKGSYAECCAWIKEQCKALGMETRTVEPVKDHPIVVASLQGEDPSLPSVVLNSHYDVVPVMEEEWHVDAFAAVEKDGKIYGRGTQDMKCVCAQYLLALRRLLADGSRFRRTIHLTFVPDEEIGGKDGMQALISSGLFEELCAPVGIVMDEGLANTTDKYTLFHGERLPMWIVVTADGPTGHGSRFIPETAVEKLIHVANEALEFRRVEEKKLGYRGGCKHCEAKKLGDVTTVNLTMLNAGVSMDQGKTYSLNVIPTKAQAGFDIRVATTFPVSELEAMLNEWTKAQGLKWEYASWTKPNKRHCTTSVDADENPWWGKFEEFCKISGIQVVKEIFPAATDSRFLRNLDIPAFGFSPMNRSPILLHEHNEYLERSVFLDGVSKYCDLIPTLANAERHKGDVADGPAAKKLKEARE